MDTAKKAAKTVSNKAEWVWKNKKKVAATLLGIGGAVVAAGYELGWVAPGWIKAAAQVLGAIAGGDG